MPSIDYDLKYLQAGLVDLEGYLLSNELYWPIGASPPVGEVPYPRLTLGNLLLAEARLRARRLDSQQKIEHNRLKERVESNRSQWRVAWGKKASREYSARSRLWRDFLGEYRRSPWANVDRYSYEVTRRVLLQLLEKEAEDVPPEELELLSTLDAFLKAVLIEGPFLWDEELQEAFPKDTYWYLYGAPKSQEDRLDEQV